ncbi:MAG: class I SAM-dependent methyltransferase [Polyangiaceae bacterium]|nr:class I SAM-dependent methyltransferase [Polyangiaceae bacterium]
MPLLRCVACGHSYLSTVGVDLSHLYDTHYTGFREDPTFQRRVREVLEDAVSPHIPAKARVLDVGCGNGEFLAAAAELGHTVFGLDFSEAAAEACLKRGVLAVAGDFLKYDFGDRAPFDLITLWDVVEHLDHPFEVMVRARELLAPGGCLLLKVPCFTERGVWIAAHVPRVAGALLGAPSHIQYFNPRGLRRLLSRAGFASVHTEKLAAMRSLSPPKNPIGAAKRKFIAELGKFAGNENTLVLARA